MYGLGVNSYMNVDEDTYQKIDCETVKKFLSLGYKIKEEAYYSQENYLFLGLELKHKHEIIDEIVLAFNQNEDCNMTGTINARQMNWFINQNSKLESLALNLDCKIVDIIIPNSSQRLVDNGFAYYNSRKGAVGFKIELIQNDVKIHGVLKIKENQTKIEETIHSSFYPKMYTLHTLV